MNITLKEYGSALKHVGYSAFSVSLWFLCFNMYREVTKAFLAGSIMATITGLVICQISDQSLDNKTEET